MRTHTWIRAALAIGSLAASAWALVATAERSRANTVTGEFSLGVEITPTQVDVGNPVDAGLTRG